MFWNLLILDLMIMLLSWLLATLNGRAGIVDAAWSFCLAVNIIVSSLLISVAPVEVRLLSVFLAAYGFKIILAPVKTLSI